MLPSTRRRHSSITRLPPELKAEVDRLLESMTLEQIVQHMRKLGVNLSKSAVHRHSMDWRATGDFMRRFRQMANTIGTELPDMNGDASRLAVEALQAMLMQAVTAIIESGKDIDHKHLQALSSTAKDLAFALKANVDAELKVRERAMKDVQKVAEKRGLSADILADLKGAVLGVKSP